MESIRPKVARDRDKADPTPYNRLSQNAKLLAITQILERQNMYEIVIVM